MLLSLLLVTSGLAQTCAFTSQPVGGAACVGGSYTFVVQMDANDPPSYQYQWYKSTSPIIGATSATLELTNLTASSAGQYRVVVTHTLSPCIRFSNLVPLTINGPASISTQPTAQAACEGSRATFSVQATGDITGYQWYKNGTAISGATGSSYQTPNATLADNGAKYKVDVIGSCGTVTSSEVTLGVQAKPAITLQPLGATKCVGDNYTFTSTATNAGTYQWLKDGSDLTDQAGDISGSTTNQLTLTNLCATCDPGSYVLEVTGTGACAAETINTNAAILVVNTPVSINTQPTAQAVCEGTTATFSVAATGTITGYQWYRNGTAITGATNNSYQLITSTANNGDKYKVDVIGACGTVTSNEATLTVQSKPSITLQPVGATKCVGDNYTFTSTATNAGTYQWLKDGANLSDQAGDISGSTTNQLTLTNLCATCDPGSYVLRVSGTGACASETVNTNAAILVVNTPVAISTQPSAQAVCEGSAATFSVAATGTITGYQWYRNSTAISGATASSYQLTTTTANNGDTYKVEVQGSCGNVLSSEVTLSVQAKPAITAQPVGATKCVGEGYTFTVTATSAGSYQWQKDGANLSGAAGASLALTNLQSSGQGTYRVVVNGTGACSSEQTTSADAPLVINVPVSISTQPTAQAVCEGSGATFSVQAAGTISGYQWYRNGAAISGATTSNYQLTTSTANNGDTYKVEVQGPCGNVLSSEATLSVQAKPLITAQPAGATKCVGDNYTFTGTATNAGGYQWLKDGANMNDQAGDISGSTTNQLTLTNLCANCDPGSYVLRVSGTGACASETVNTNAAVLVVNTPVAISTQPSAQAVCEGGAATFSVAATGTITGYQWYRNGTAISGATGSSYQLTTTTANNGDTYKIDVIGSCGTVTSSEVTLSVQAKPAITAQPIGATKCVGEGYTFTVTATSAGSYQWQKDGANLAAATGASLALTNLQTANAGTYRVVVNGTGACASEQTTSSNALLVINVPVSISTQPTAQAVCEGSGTTFSVAATGTITGYQWYRNGTAITGATSNSYQLTTSTANNGDKYKVDIIGACGTVTSNEATLTVQSKPSITAQPVGATKCVGDNYTFTSTATNAGTYQWLKDGANLSDQAGDISGSTTNQLTLTNLCATCDPGSYVLRVSGTGACASETVNTNAATLVVNTPVAISTQPAAQAVCEGSGATFTVQASGTITGYQWYRNSTAISGATASSYQLTTSTANNGDTYKVEVQGPCGNLMSSEVTLSVQAKPAITAQPVRATKCVGESYSFTVAATNAGTYQWQKDGVDVAGATSATLTLATIQQVNAGTYQVRIGGVNTCGGEQVVSGGAVLTVNVPITISTQPVAVAVCEGITANYGVVAGGTITGYQWYRNNVPINGANASTFAVVTTPANSGDTYTVEVLGPCGSVVSSPATLAVQTKPAITAQPAGAARCVGEGYTLAVTATNAGSYQWQKDGSNLANATGASLALTNLQTANAGTYRVLVNGIGTCASEQVNSSTAFLLVNTPVAITTQPAAQSVCEGSGATFSVAATGTITGYQWYRNGTAINGANTNSYQLTTSTANNGDTYKVEVQGPCGAVTSDDVTLTVQTKPSITQQPVGATKCAGESYALVVTATDAGTYQWQKDGADLAGATSATLTLNNLQEANLGTYQVRVGGVTTCAAQQLTSTGVFLLVNTPITITTPVLAQTVCEGSDAAFNVAARGTILGYRWYRNGQQIAGSTATSHALKATSANNEDRYKVEITGPCGNVFSQEVMLTVIRIDPPTITTNKPNGMCDGDQTELTANASSGTVTWFLNGNAVATGNTYTTRQPGTYTTGLTDRGCTSQTRSNAVAVTQLSPVTFVPTVQNVTCFAGTDGAISISPAGAAGEPYAVSWTNPTGTTANNVRNLAAGTYTFTVTDRIGCRASGSLVVTQPTQPSGSVTGTDVSCFGRKDGRVAINARSDYGSFSYSLNGGTLVAFTAATTQTLTGLDKGAYTVRVVDSKNCEVLPATVVTITEPTALTAAISVATNPRSFESKDGTVVLSAAGGLGSYTAQWYDAAGAELTGPVQTTATTTALISRLAPVDGGTYRVVVSDRNGCQQTLTQTLVTPKRIVATASVDSISCFGRNDGRATVTVTGGVPSATQPGYQSVWQRRGASVSAGNSFSVASLAPGTYDVTITDANGISTTATVQLSEPARLTTTVSRVAPNYCLSQPLGEATLQTTGGRAPYRLAWNGTAIAGNTITKLPSGRQAFTVTDASGCVATTETVVADSTRAFTVGVTYTMPTCFGRCDGLLTSTIQGGFAPYRYSWRDLPSTQPTALSVCGSGETALTITDAKGCVLSSASVARTSPAPRALNLPTTQEVCPSKSFTLTAAAVNWGKTVSWRFPGGTTRTGTSIQADSLGTYTVTVLDENSCGGTAQLTVKPFANVQQLFTVPSEAVVGKTVVAVDLTNPVPSSVRWELPGGTLVNQDAFTVKLKYDKVGTFRITELATVDNCVFTLTKSIDIKANLDDNGFPRPMGFVPLDVQVMGNPLPGRTLQLTIANEANEAFSVSVQPITGHGVVFTRSYGPLSSPNLTIELPADVPDGRYVLTVQSVTTRVTRTLLIAR